MDAVVVDIFRIAILAAAGWFAYQAFRRWQLESASSAPGLAPASPPPQSLYSIPAAAAGSAAHGVSANGEAFIKGNEGFSLYPYVDAGGQSIYWGHFIRPGETFSHTQADAENYFARDIAAVESAIAADVHVALSQGQYDAIADFIYNEGAGAFANSTLLERLNAGDYAGAGGELSKWVYSRGVKLASLQSRRAAEQALFA